MTYRTISLVLCFVATLLFAACGPKPAKESDVTDVLNAFYGGMSAGNSTAVMEHIAPDAMFLESGKLETRAEYEANHLPGDIAFEKQVQGKRGPMRVRIEGDTAWVIATSEYDGTFDGRPVNFVGAQLAVLSRTNERWMIQSIHWSSRQRSR